jgi:dTDP-4-amino-4,6-dideoxygalactose transaminase
MRSTFLPFSPPDLEAAEVDEVLDTLRSDWITTGPKTKRFEDQFAAYVGAPAAAAVNSCTAATMVALAAFGIGPGDAVITTTLTFVSTVHVIEHVGATPILVDIDPATLNMDPRCLGDALADAAARGLNATAVIPVHFAGLPCDMGAIMDFARTHQLAVVEDAAHSLPASIDGRMIGAVEPDMRHATAFSFYATKNLTTGEGGMLTGSADFIEEARLWILHGMSRDAWTRYGKGGAWFYEVIRPGFKCNMTDIAASIGIHQLDRLPALHERRVDLAAFFDDALRGLPLTLPPSEARSVHARHLYPIRLHLDALTIDRGRFINELTRRNIGSSVHFIPVHNHPYYRDRYGFVPNQFPEAQRAFASLVSLPMNTRMTESDATDVVEAVHDIYARFSR